MRFELTHPGLGVWTCKTKKGDMVSIRDAGVEVDQKGWDKGVLIAVVVHEKPKVFWTRSVTGPTIGADWWTTLSKGGRK